ncbi:xanthine dehydrogenase small subunit [Alphaproteobacteria bacterium]|nr:xanthine dehydrogenase small subunit [Alphaproteobacteria bacterium]
MIKNEIEFILNDELIKINNVDTNVSVLNYLRIDKRLTGTKEGCASGDCGACTAIITELKNNKLEYKAVNTCIMFLYSLHGKQLITVEHLSNSKLHPVQQSMVDNHGSQCGFCTPGFVMSMFGMYKDKVKPSNQNIDEYLAGNLCRCTGYNSIKKAAKKMYSYGKKDKFSKNENKIIKLLKKIKHNDILISKNNNKFYIPLNLKNLIQYTQNNNQYKFVTGGTDIALEVTKKNNTINSLIYLGNNKDLNYIKIEKNYINIGSATPINKIIPILKKYYPSFAEMFYRYGSTQIRNVASIGGNLGSASPIGDSLPALLALNAKLILQSKKQRVLSINNFFKSYRKTDLKNKEFIKEIRIPILKNHIFKCYKISKRIDDDISSLFVAYLIKLKNNIIIDIDIAYGGMDSIPNFAFKTQKYLIGKEFNLKNIEKSKEIIEKDFTPLTDVRASSSYRKLVSKNLMDRLFLEINNNKVRI